MALCCVVKSRACVHSTPRPRRGREELRNYLTICGFDLIVKYVSNYGGSLDRVFQALANGTRRTMIERLVRGPASVGELAKPLEMSLPAVMQHIQVLEARGLVRSEKTVRVRTCRIEPDALRAVEDWTARQRTSWEGHLDRLADCLTDDLSAPDQGSTR